MTGSAGCCARAASGHAAAALPSSVMNSRRFMGAPLSIRGGHYHTVAEERRCASQQKLRDDVADGSIVLIKSPMRGLRLCIRALGTRLRPHFLNARVGAELH